MCSFSSELTKTWSLGATEFWVGIGNCNVKVWKSTEDKLHKIWNSKYFCQKNSENEHTLVFPRRGTNLSRNFPFERINRLQCYELTRRYSHLLFTQILPLTYVVHPWSVHCEYAMKHGKRWIFNYLQIRDTPLTLGNLLFGKIFAENCMKIK